MQTSSSTQNIYDNIVYYQNHLLKKEGLNNWVNYWVVIKGKWLLFYQPIEQESRPTKLVKTIELPNGSKCSMVPRSKRRFPFSLNNGYGSYYFKCETELQRYSWIVCTLLASTGQAPKPAPKSIPKEFTEGTVDPKMAKYEKKIEHSNKKLEYKKAGQKDKLVSKHRIRYAQRLETKAKRFLSKSNEDIHHRDSNDDDDDYEDRRPYSARESRQREFHTKESYYEDSTLRRTSSQSSGSLEIHAQIHSPVANKPRSSFPIISVSETPVMSILEIDNDEFGTVHVIPHDEVLPNMVLEERRKAAPLSIRSNRENSGVAKSPHSIIHSHSMGDIGKTNLGINIDDETVSRESKLPLGATSRTRTGLSGLPSPRLNSKKTHAEKMSNENNMPRNDPGKRNFPKSPAPKSRYSRYTNNTSDA